MAASKFCGLQMVTALVVFLHLLTNLLCDAASSSYLPQDNEADLHSTMRCNLRCDQKSNLPAIQGLNPHSSQHSSPPESLGPQNDVLTSSSEQFQKARERPASQIFTISPSNGISILPFGDQTNLVTKQLRLLKASRKLQPPSSLFDYNAGKVSFPLN